MADGDGVRGEADYEFAERYAEERQNSYYRWGTAMLRGGGHNYSPCVKDKTGWQNYFLSLPYDYDVRNDRTFDLKRSTYHRLGDLGFGWPETTTKEAMRTGFNGPDKNSLTRPAFLRFKENDRRPEPAYRLHLTDRASLHLMRADPLEGVLPFGRQNDMHGIKSVSHRDFKWRRRCCAKPPQNPTFEQRVYRLAKTDLHKSSATADQVMMSNNDLQTGDSGNVPLLKLKKAYNWPINTITSEPLGGRLLYYNKTADTDSGAPSGEPKVIPDQRCQLLANGPKKTLSDRPLHYHNASVLDLRFPTPNWECWEEVPDCCKTDLPSECCFNTVSTKGPPTSQKPRVCPPKPPCPTFY